MSSSDDAADVALIFPGDVASYFLPAFKHQMPGRRIQVGPELDSPNDVAYVMSYTPPAGTLGQLPNLRCVMSIGAGIDHLASDPSLPAHVPVVRCIQPDLIGRMVEYITLYVLTHHRQVREYREFQTRREWHPMYPPAATGRTVGILGLGKIGRACAVPLMQLGFRVRGYSRTLKQVEGVTCYSGSGQLNEFLSGCEILVNLLPLTETTRGMIDRKFLAQLPAGACLINAGRGATVVDEDLMAALESGQIAEATLDAFVEEPLPAESPWWDHPRVNVLPHVAGSVTPDALAEFMAWVIERMEAGDNLSEFTADPELGY